MRREDSLKGRKGLASPPFRNSGFDIGVQRTTLGENPCQESAGRICLLAPLAFSLPLSHGLFSRWQSGQEGTHSGAGLQDQREAKGI